MRSFDYQRTSARHGNATSLEQLKAAGGLRKMQNRRLANMYLEFAESANARPDIELPRLRNFAEEIQALIDKEYR